MVATNLALPAWLTRSELAIPPAGWVAVDHVMSWIRTRVGVERNGWRRRSKSGVKRSNFRHSEPARRTQILLPATLLPVCTIPDGIYSVGIHSDGSRPLTTGVWRRARHVSDWMLALRPNRTAASMLSTTVMDQHRALGMPHLRTSIPSNSCTQSDGDAGD